MLRVIESLSNGPIKVQTDINARFIPGQVAQMNYKDVKCVVSDGTSPFGIIDDIKTDTTDSTDPAGYISVWVQRMIFRTDQYEVHEEDISYETGDLLYVNDRGFLTNLKMKEVVGVGRVISVFPIKEHYEREIIECIWF